jgi:hypothetical protein
MIPVPMGVRVWLAVGRIDMSTHSPLCEGDAGSETPALQRSF